MNPRPIEELIGDLDSYTGFTKYVLMDEAVERREEIAPHLLAILERILADPGAWLDEDHDITCHALILLAHFEETRAHRLVLDLCRLPEGLPDTLFGEFLGETMPAVLYKTSGGQQDGVRALILDGQADEFVRWNAATALTYAVAGGVLAHDEVVAFFAELLGKREAAEPDSIFWTGILDALFSLHPDRLEVVNPGLLPLGVTPQNILHQSVRRNNELARVFHDLGLMEREGSGYDLIFEVLLSQGRPLPKLFEGPDFVKVVVEKRIVKREVIDFLAKADQTFFLRQREKITLGLLAQSDAMTAKEMADALELADAGEIASWLGRLLDFGIVRKTGRTKGTRYFVEPEFLRRLEFPSQTSLARIEPHRLDALVLEDIGRYPGSAIGEIHERIGPEIKRRQVKLALDRLCEKDRVRPEGEKRGRRYWPR